MWPCTMPVVVTCSGPDRVKTVSGTSTPSEITTSSGVATAMLKLNDVVIELGSPRTKPSAVALRLRVTTSE